MFTREICRVSGVRDISTLSGRLLVRLHAPGRERRLHIPSLLQCRGYFPRNDVVPIESDLRALLSRPVSRVISHVAQC